AGGGEALAHRRLGRRLTGGKAYGAAVPDRRQAAETAQLARGGERRTVGDVVGVAGKPVEGVDMDAQVAADQPRADREILVAAPFARGRLDAGSTIGRRPGFKHGHRT